jgi:hypothetical protein
MYDRVSEMLPLADSQAGLMEVGATFLCHLNSKLEGQGRQNHVHTHTFSLSRAVHNDIHTLKTYRKYEQ